MQVKWILLISVALNLGSFNQTQAASTDLPIGVRLIACGKPSDPQSQIDACNKHEACCQFLNTLEPSTGDEVPEQLTQPQDQELYLYNQGEDNVPIQTLVYE